MTSIILSGLKRLNELGSWRALRFSEQFMSFDKGQKQRGAIFFFTTTSIGWWYWSDYFKNNPRTDFEGQVTVWDGKVWAPTRKNASIFAAASPFIFKKSYDLFMMTTKQHHYKNREHKF